MVEVTKRIGFFGAFAQAIKGVLFGGVLILLAPIMLFWNECNSVTTAQSLAEGAAAVVSVSPDTIDAANDGKLVHVSGDATTDETLTDADFGVSLKAIKLKREVEMYQWVEKSTTKSSSNSKKTKYTYSKQWRTGLVKSSKFEDPKGHTNPETMPYQAQESAAKNVTLGGFTLSTSQIEYLTPEATYLPPETSYTQQDGYLYLSGSPAEPTIGTVRVRFLTIEPGPVSVVAQQSGSTFAPYQTSAGKQLDMIQLGTATSEEMFSDAATANTVFTWILRVVGFFMIVISLNLLIGPLSVLSDQVPSSVGCSAPGYASSRSCSASPSPQSSSASPGSSRGRCWALSCSAVHSSRWSASEPSCSWAFGRCRRAQPRTWPSRWLQCRRSLRRGGSHRADQRPSR